MAVLKGANWEEILEQHRDGVVQILVVKKKYLWKAAYRSALSEQISGSGFFIQNAEFEVSTKNDLLVVTNAHVAKNAAQINILVLLWARSQSQPKSSVFAPSVILPF